MRANAPAAPGDPSRPAGSRHVVADGVRCRVLEAGEGSPLVLLHGTAIDSASLTYGPTLPALAARHRVLALDWPGYGDSERPRVATTTDDLVRLLASFLGSETAEPVHLAGFSMGGAVALGLALSQPARVRSLTLIGGYGFDANLPLPLLPYLALRAPGLSASVTFGLRNSRRLVRQVLSRLVFSDPTLVTPELVDAVHEQLRVPEAERSFVAWLRGEMRPLKLGTSFAGELAGLRLPTLLLHGRNDRVVPRRKAVRAHEAIAGSELVMVPGCGHWVPREAPAVFVRALLAFTRRHDALA